MKKLLLFLLVLLLTLGVGRIFAEDTPTETETPTVTETPTETATETFTETYTPTDTSTSTNTPTRTSTRTFTVTQTPTKTATPTLTPIPTFVISTWGSAPKSALERWVFSPLIDRTVTTITAYTYAGNPAIGLKCDFCCSDGMFSKKTLDYGKTITTTDLSSDTVTLRVLHQTSGLSVILYVKTTDGNEFTSAPMDCPNSGTVSFTLPATGAECADYIGMRFTKSFAESGAYRGYIYIQQLIY
jgi:hypothetical protein